MKNTSVLTALTKLYTTNISSDVLADISTGYLTENTCRNGRDVLWYSDENTNTAIYIDTLELLSEAEIERELM